MRDRGVEEGGGERGEERRGKVGEEEVCLELI